jgi:nickel/cobalt exporter
MFGALIRTAVLSLLLCLALSMTTEGLAQSPNPFRPSPAAPANAQAAPAPTQPVAEQSIYAKALAWMISLQSTMMRDIRRYMTSIRDDASPIALLTGIWFAFVYGVVHTLGPGHGKMIVASYFVGHEARIWRGLLVGIQIAVTHVIASVVLVLIVDSTFKLAFGSEPAESWWIRLFSFAIIAIIGAYMLFSAIRASLGNGGGHGDDHNHHHGHGHDHDHSHAHAHGKRESMLAILSGIVPCTGAILIMLASLAFGIVYAGVLMVIAISVGMAMTMAAIGVAAIMVRRVMLLVSGEGSHRSYILATVLEYAAAIVILAVGLSFLAGTIGEKYL